MPSRPPSAPAEGPTVAQLAETIHRRCTGAPGCRLVHLELLADERLSVGFWPVPDGAVHPADPLVGFRAPQRWHALGLVATGRLLRADGSEGGSPAVTATVLVRRDGATAGVLSDGLRPTRVIVEPPTGWVADGLRRALGLPTPAPGDTLASLIDATWLDRLAGADVGAQWGKDSWGRLADLHPLRRPGPAPAPEDLAARTTALARAITWTDLRRRSPAPPLPAATVGPPGGAVLTTTDWFDDGSFSRWSHRGLPPAGALLPQVDARLAPEGAALVRRALVDADREG